MAKQSLRQDKRFDTPATYRIRIEGRIDTNWADRLGGMALAESGFHTYVYSRGPEGSPPSQIVKAFGGEYISSEAFPVDGLPGRLNGIDNHLNIRVFGPCDESRSSAFLYESQVVERMNE